MSTNKTVNYERAYLREKKARKHSEELLEVKSREIFKINREIEEKCNALVKRTTELELFHEIAIFVQKDITTEEALQYFIDVVCSSFNWPIGHICIPDKNDKLTVNSTDMWHINIDNSSNDFAEKEKFLNWKSGEDLPGYVLQYEKGIWLSNVSENELCKRKSIFGVEVNNAFALPIKAYGRVIAIAEFFSGEQLSSDESLLNIVEIAAIQLGTVLERRLSEKKTLANYNELQKTVEKLQNTQIQLVQSEKLASVGQLAAGVAHEINNPIGFVSSNIRTLTEYMSDFKEMLSYSDDMISEHAGDNETLQNAIASKADELDITFLNEDIDQLLADCSDGMSRVQDIVLGLKNFSRVDSEEMELIDINECITSTLRMLDNELKYKAEVIQDLATLPKIHCNAGKLNQVFTNILVNAGHAIEEQGSINVNTTASDDFITVTISDTGKGIPEENMKSLFDPFFTTKAVGEGTGLGLSISYGIVQEHNGTIEVDSVVNQGTTFKINLPRVHTATNAQVH